MKTVEVACAIIIESNNIFVCKRKPELTLGGLWEFPGGKINPGESSKDAIIREVREELEAEIEPYEFCATVEYDYDNLGDKSFHIVLHAWYCYLIAGMLKLKDHSEGRFRSYASLKEIEFCPADKLIIETMKNKFND